MGVVLSGETHPSVMASEKPSDVVGGIFLPQTGVLPHVEFVSLSVAEQLIDCAFRQPVAANPLPGRNLQQRGPVSMSSVSSVIPDVNSPDTPDKWEDLESMFNVLMWPTYWLEEGFIVPFPEEDLPSRLND